MLVSWRKVINVRGGIELLNEFRIKDFVVFRRSEGSREEVVIF